MVKRNTLILLIAALLLAVGVLVYDQVSTQQEKVKADQQKLFAFKPEEVKQIQIVASGTTIEAERQVPGSVASPSSSSPVPTPSPADDKWQIKQPISTAADTFAVNNLLQSAISLTPQAKIEKATNLAQYGLDPAEKTLTLTLQDGKQKILKLGSADFDGSGLYAQTDDGSVITIPKSQQTTLAPNLLGLRDKVLVSAVPIQFQSVEVLSSKPKSSLTIKPAPQGGWQLLTPAIQPADPNAINTFFNPLSRLEATDFVAEPKTKAKLVELGLAPPVTQIRIEFQPRNGSIPVPLTLDLGSEKDGKVYVTTSQSDQIAEISAAAIKPLQKSAADLRSKQLGKIVPEAINEIKVTSASDPSLNRTLLPAASTSSSLASPVSRLWELSDQPGRSVNLDSFLTTLTTSEATEFLPASDRKANAVLKSPQLMLAIASAGGSTLELSLSGDKDHTYVRSSYQPDILVLETSTLDSLTSALTGLKPVPSPAPTVSSDPSPAATASP